MDAARATASQITIAARASASGYPAAIAQITGQVTPKRDAAF